MARINDFVSTEINLEDFKFGSWLDIGTAEGLVAQEFRGTAGIPDKHAIDPGTFPEDLDRGELFHFLDDNWQKHTGLFNKDNDLWKQKFDFITLMDTIQYHNKDEGIELLDRLIENTNKLLIVWTPEGYYPHSGHKSCWHERDFTERGMKIKIAEGFHEGPPIKGNGLLSWIIK